MGRDEVLGLLREHRTTLARRFAVSDIALSGMSTSRYRGEIEAPDDIQAPDDGSVRDKGPRHLDVSNEMQKMKPEVDETILDGATRQLSDMRKPPCIV